MKRASILVALMVVIGMVAVPAVGAVAQEDQTDEDETTPGEQLSGVVGVQQAEFDGEIQRNAFTIALDRADDNATKAGHIAEKLTETEERLAELEERKAQLDEQRANGEISEGQYRAQTAKMATEVETAKQQLNKSEEAASGIPEETLKENGVNVSAIETLRGNANELSGGEVSEIARSIAGDRSGVVDRGDDRAGDRGDQRQDDRTDDAQQTESDDQEESEERTNGDEQQSSDQQTSSDEQTTDDDTTDSDSDDDTGSQGGNNAGNSGNAGQ